MRRAKLAILISIVLIGGLVLFSLWENLQKRKASEEKEGLPEVSANGAAMRLEKIRFVEDKFGRRTWELEARLIQQYQDQNIIMLDEVKAILYTKEGRSFTLSGNRATVHQDSKDMELVGDVVLTSNDGYRLKTHSVAYHHSDKRVTSPDPVEIEGDQIRVEGRGMLVDMEGKVFKVLDGVKTQWRGGLREGQKEVQKEVRKEAPKEVRKEVRKGGQKGKRRGGRRG